MKKRFTKVSKYHNHQSIGKIRLLIPNLLYNNLQILSPVSGSLDFVSGHWKQWGEVSGVKIKMKKEEMDEVT